MSNLTVRGNPSGTGTFTVESPNSNNNRTITLPDATTTLVGTDATQTLTNKTINGGAITLGTAQASTSGTSIDFTGIPSWVKRVTVVLAGVSTSGASLPCVRLGTSGGVVSTGYVGVVDSQNTGGGATISDTSGLLLCRNGASSASNVLSGQAVFINVTGNNWVGTFTGTITTGVTMITWAATQVTLSATLDRIRITTVNGTDTFDAGTINIMYEG